VLDVRLDPGAVGLGDQLHVVGRFAPQDMRQSVKETTSLFVSWEAIRDHEVVGSEALRVLLHMLAVKRPAVDDHDLGRTQHATEGFRLEPKSA